MPPCPPATGACGLTDVRAGRDVQHGGLPLSSSGYHELLDIPQERDGELVLICQQVTIYCFISEIGRLTGGSFSGRRVVTFDRVRPLPMTF